MAWRSSGRCGAGLFERQSPQHPQSRDCANRGADGRGQSVLDQPQRSRAILRNKPVVLDRQARIEGHWDRPDLDRAEKGRTPILGIVHHQTNPVTRIDASIKKDRRRAFDQQRQIGMAQLPRRRWCKCRIDDQRRGLRTQTAGLQNDIGRIHRATQPNEQ